jgi:hypothetical protein
MKTTIRTNTVATQWTQAVRGNDRARSELLERIMPARRGR